MDHEAVRSATASGIHRCESGERRLADLLTPGRGLTGLPGPGDPTDHRGATARRAGIALLDNVRELRASLVRFDDALLGTG